MTAQAELATSFKTLLRQAQKNSIELCREFIEDLIQKRSKEWNMDPCEALFIIQEAENSRKHHRKHNFFMKKQLEGTLRQLLVLVPLTGADNDIRDKKQYYNIEDPDHIFKILLQRNFTALQRSKDSIFASGPFATRLGLHGEGTEFYEDLLQGNIDPSSFDEHYPQFTGELSLFITALRSKVKEGDAAFQWDFGVKEFKATFKKTRESTACDPSSIHMSHFKAATERGNIARVHAFFIWAAFRYSFSYERWETSWHCMLQKMQDPYVDKLRIIQLFEGDFNAGLKCFLGKLLMQHITQHQYTDSETYGSRISKSATEALITLQTLFAHTSTWNTTAAMIFNDAAGCYDRIPLVWAELAAVSAGCSKSIMRCHTLAQRNMKHYVKTAAGVSTSYIKFSPTYAISFLMGFVILQGLIGGIGQGGGGGPILWLLVSTIMIQALRKLSKGAEMAHVLDWMRIMLWIVSYVDDNTLLQTYPIGTSPAPVIAELTKMMTHWHRLLQITCRDLALPRKMQTKYLSLA
jgi:hypothetical protein